MAALASLLAAGGGLGCGGGAVIRSAFLQAARLRAAMATAVAAVGSVRLITMTSRFTHGTVIDDHRRVISARDKASSFPPDVRVSPPRPRSRRSPAPAPAGR